MSTRQGDAIWYDDIGVLAKRWNEFFPAADHTPTERVNALVRLVMYCTMGIFVYNRSMRTLVVGATIIALVSYMFASERGKEAYPKPSQPLVVAKEDGLRCTPPTKDNPFANVLLTDLSKDRPPACEYDSVKDDIRKHFNNGLPRNATDVYELENSQRQFYTMPNTRSIPDTGAFAKFLYGTPTSCKDTPADCPPSRM